jgi:hypothetical protein
MRLYHTTEALDERTRERLRAMLAGNERFALGITVPDGLYKRRRSRLVLTDARLLGIKHGYGVHVETESHLLSELSDVRLTEGGRAELELTGPDGGLAYPLEPGDAAEFADGLRRALAWDSGN